MEVIFNDISTWHLGWVLFQGSKRNELPILLVCFVVLFCLEIPPNSSSTVLERPCHAKNQYSHQAVSPNHCVTSIPWTAPSEDQLSSQPQCQHCRNLCLELEDSSHCSREGPDLGLLYKKREGDSSPQSIFVLRLTREAQVLNPQILHLLESLPKVQLTLDGLTWINPTTPYSSGLENRLSMLRVYIYGTFSRASRSTCSISELQISPENSPHGGMQPSVCWEAPGKI